MYKAIGSRREIKKDSRFLSQYYEDIEDIISQNDIKELDNYYQHLKTSRLQHSINVSYYSYKIAKLLGLNHRAAARAGLMHDMYYYEFGDTALSCAEHSQLHSELALENARKITEVDSLEADIILTHMWPLTDKAPSHMEGFVVTFADKCCACMEVVSKIPEKIRSKKLFKFQH